MGRRGAFCIRIGEQQRRAPALVLATMVAALTMAGAPAACAASSSALAWGYNELGEFGNGTTTNSDVPVEVNALSGVTAMSAGLNYGLGLLSNGTVMAWGSNGVGQLGNGSTTNSDVPVEVKGLSEVTAISAGHVDSLALLKTGTVVGWGANEFGQLGDGTTTGPETCPPGTVPCSRTPVAVEGLSGVTAISAGGSHSLALLSNGTVMAWGANFEGELGNGTTTNSDVPVEVKGLSGVTAISARGSHSLALLSNGTVMEWGANRDVPVEVGGLSAVTAISAGESFSLALLSSGKVMAWGGNFEGELGNGTTTNSSTPVEVKGLSGVTAISAGERHSLALLSNGKVMAWGSPSVALGGATPCCYSDVPVEGALVEATAISAGGGFSLALGTPVPIVTTASLPEGHVGVGYSQTLAAIGGTNPYTWSLAGGSLPAGLSLNATSGAITGTPSAPGISNFTVKVTDSRTPTSQTATAHLSITVTSLEPPTFATSFTPENIEGSFSEPNAVALDPSGDIWVADSGHNRVLEFNKERKFLREVGIEYGEVQFKGIQGIATNSAGDVYVTASDSVQEFSPSGAFLRQWGSPGSGNGQFLDPIGVAVDSSGNVWVLDRFNYRVQEFSENGAFLKAFGSQGTGNGQFGWASGLAFSGGNLYVADSARVQEFSTAGTFIATFGSSGTGNGQFHGLGGIATDPTTGDLYISDTNNNRVQKFTAAGAFLAAFGSSGSGAGQFSAPIGVAVNSSGTLYVADTGNNRIEEWLAGEPPTFATSVTAPNNLEGAFKEPDAVAVDPSGNIWVADSGHNRVLEFNKERKFLRQVGIEYGEVQFKGIQGIATNSAGDVYVTASDSVQEFSPAGEFLRRFGSPGSGNGQFLYPTGIAVDSNGNVWVLDTFNYRVQEFSESGEYLTQHGSPRSASGLAFSGGNLYVAATASVQEFSTSGTFIAQFGSSGSGNGQFRGLGGIATDPRTGSLYVSDISNNRVEEFSQSGGFITAFGTAGSGNGQFSSPKGVAVNSLGDVYVTDAGNARVQEWLPGT